MSNHATTTSLPITRLTLRDLEGSTKYYYHRYRSAEEAFHEEQKAIIAGQRIGVKQLDRLKIDRDEAYQTLLQYLAEITRRVRIAENLTDQQDDDANAAQYFRQRQRLRDQAAAKQTEE